MWFKKTKKTTQQQQTTGNTKTMGDTPFSGGGDNASTTGSTPIGSDIQNIFDSILTKTKKYVVNLGNGQTMVISFSDLSGTATIVLGTTVLEYPFTRA